MFPKNAFLIKVAKKRIIASLFSFGTLAILGAVVFTLTACVRRQQTAEPGPLKVVATTSLVGDVVSQVGGDKINLNVLLPLGADPHSFSPTPRDASRIADADIVFSNGVGLEDFLKPLMDSVGNPSKVVEVSQGIDYLTLVEEGSLSSKPVDDPHTWMDPNNVIIWTQNIAKTLSTMDPANADYYLKNSQEYQAQLTELDGWIRSQVSLVPLADRLLVTEHLVFGYFSARYGFTQVGAIIPGFSSLAEPSAQDIAQIEDAIIKMGVKAIFIGIGVNPSLSQQIAADTGTQIVPVYMESLSSKSGPASTYLDFMRYDVNAIVNALR
jgi:manganese/iron transport system substrate-binding protein